MRRMILALVAAAATLATACTAGAATLKDSVVVSDSYIRLGDLFTEAGDKADVAVAYAPAPGRTATLDARWLYRVAYAYGIAWRPLSERERAVVRRDSQIIPREEITTQIEAALIDKGADPNQHAVLANRSLEIHVPSGSLASVEVEDTVFDARTRRFSAVISAPAGDPGAKRYRLTGRMHTLRDVPTLAHRIMAGRVITESDLQWTPMRADLLQRDIILDANELIGKTPRRPIRAGQTIRLSDVQRPVVVAKGSLVTIVLRAPNMRLTAKGRALEDGADGDAIRVSNSRSNQVIEAVVAGPNTVAVETTPRLAQF